MQHASLHMYVRIVYQLGPLGFINVRVMALGRTNVIIIAFASVAVFAFGMCTDSDCQFFIFIFSCMPNFCKNRVSWSAVQTALTHVTMAPQRIFEQL